MERSALVEIDHVIVLCNGCRGARKVVFEKPLRTTEGLDAWLKEGLDPCSCGAKTCDVMAHMVELTN